MIRAFSRALAQLGDSRFLSVLLTGLALTLALLVGAALGTSWLVGWLVPDSVSLPWVGEIGWIDSLASGLSLLGVLALSVVLMVPVASAFTGLFLDRVADAVEDRYYPGLPPARGQDWGEVTNSAGSPSEINIGAGEKIPLA